MLVLTRKTDESITIGNDIEVSVLEIKNNQVKLGIKAPKNIPVYRTEIYEGIIQENIEASKIQGKLDLFPGILNKKKDS